MHSKLKPEEASSRLIASHRSNSNWTPPRSAKAEEERLLREKQDQDKRYNDFIASADKAFTAKKYEEARTDVQCVPPA
jgi:hypothetical protein